MNSYKDKTALVTGASSGIGLAIANSLARRGAHLILTARSTNKLNEVAKGIRDGGNRAHIFSGDLSQAGAAKQLYKEVLAANLKVDLLVNNAGYGRWGDFTEFGRDDYAQMIQLNITSLTELCHLFIPAMVSRSGGGVINIGSTASFIPVPFASVYSASKAYVLLFSDALRYEYADHDVRIMTICPGATDSNFRAVAAMNSNALQTLIAKMEELGDVGASCEEVAEQGLDAFLQNKVYVVTGKGNKKFTLLPRILSRARVLNMVGDTFRKRLGK